jgi:hypothetical protein
LIDFNRDLDLFFLSASVKNNSLNWFLSCCLFFIKLAAMRLLISSALLIIDETFPSINPTAKPPALLERLTAVQH